MSTLEKISVLLPSDLLDDVRNAVANGDYGTSSDVLHEALSDWKLKRKIAAMSVENLRALWREGGNDGESSDGEGAANEAGGSTVVVTISGSRARAMRLMRGSRCLEGALCAPAVPWAVDGKDMVCSGVREWRDALRSARARQCHSSQQLQR